MKILDEQATRDALPYGELISALDSGFRDPCTAPLRHHHFQKNPSGADDVLLIMPAWRAHGYGGIKIVNVVPDNSQRGLPAISSTYILFDRKTGEHLLILDGGELTARRTAAASALAAKRLARSDSRIHLVFGAGRVGKNLPLAYREVLPIEETLILSNSFESAQQTAANLTKQGVQARAIERLDEEIDRADIISCATLAGEPILPGDRLKPGQHIDLIGSFTPEMREADDKAVQASSVYLDTDHALVESGDLVIPIANGSLSKADIQGTLVQLCQQDRYPRKHAEEITLFKAVGTAIEDLSAASLAFQRVD